MLVPHPDIVWGPLHDDDDTLAIVTTWPAGLPTGATITLQCWMDGSGSSWGATSAARITVP